MNNSRTPSESSRLRALAIALSIALPSAALGAGGEALFSLGRDLIHPTASESPSPAGSASRKTNSKSKAREFPRTATALRAELDSQPASGRTVELVSRLGILGDPSDVGRLLTLTESTHPLLSQAAIEALGRIGSPRAVDRLVTMASSNDYRMQSPAIQALGLSASPKALEALLELVEHPDQYRRQLAFQALATRGGAKARTAIHRAFAKSSEFDSWVVANALATLGEKSDRRLLVQAATRPNDPRAPAALQALTWLPDSASQELLLETARTATGRHRINALQLLGTSDSPEAVEILLEAWGTSPRLASTIIDSLATSPAPGALDGLLTLTDELRPEHTSLFAQALLRRPEPTAREVLRSLAGEAGPLADASITALSTEGDELVMELLVARLDEQGQLPPPETLTYLATHGGDAGWELLEEVLAEGNLQDRSTVVWALQSRQDDDAMHRLLDLARTSDTTTSSSAVAALENMGPFAQDNLRELLIEQLSSPEGSIDHNAAMTLARLGGEGASEVLLQRAELGTESEKYSAITALSVLEAPEAQAALEELLRDDNPTTRAAALDAMTGRIDKTISLEVLDEALADGDAGVRAAAINALSSENSPEGLERLLALIEDDDTSTQMHALSALGSRGGQEAEDALVSALTQPELARTALSGLQGLGSPTGAQAIRDYARQGDPATRSAALSMLGYDRSPEASEILTSSLSLDDPETASTAVYALQSRGNSSGAHAIAEFFDSIPLDEPEYEGLRRDTASALQMLGGAMARDRQEALEDALHRTSFEGLGEFREEGGPWDSEIMESLHIPLGMSGSGVGGS